MKGFVKNNKAISTKKSTFFGFKDRYNIIIIGGGIYGATLAWEAASRGVSVLLLEQSDFGSGVSANSLKVIHGGIRYLQKLDLSRMRQSIRERRALLRIAPHLVQPMRCIIPAFSGFGKGKSVLWVGTKIYDRIAADRNQGLDPERRIGGSEILDLKEFNRLIPSHDQKDIVGGASWWDAQVHNSERLVLAFAMSAKSKGADVCNYIKAEEIIGEKGRVRGVVAVDLQSGQKREIAGDVVMDCTGPWLSTRSGKGRPYAQAMNLVIDRRLKDFAFGMRPKGKLNRLLFFVPWREGGMIGTWYDHAPIDGDPGALTVSRHDIQLALSEVNSVLTEPSLQFEEVTAVHLGLLPALKGTNELGEPLIKDRFVIADSADKGAAGLFLVQGVKYTTARDVAIKALKAASRYLTIKPKPSMTHIMPIYGGDIPNIKEFRNDCIFRYEPKFSQSVIRRLMNNYGTHIHNILSYIDSSEKMAYPVPGAENVLQAELAFVLDHEMVHTLADLIFRRTDLGSFAMPAEETIEFCADFTANRLGWDHRMRNHNLNALYDQLPLWVQRVRTNFI